MPTRVGRGCRAYSSTGWWRGASRTRRRAMRGCCCPGGADPRLCGTDRRGISVDRAKISADLGESSTAQREIGADLGASSTAQHGISTDLADISTAPARISSAASFDHPIGTAIDSSGDIYVADCGSAQVRKITPDGDVTTYPASGVTTFGGVYARCRCSQAPALTRASPTSRSTPWGPSTRLTSETTS